MGTEQEKKKGKPRSAGRRKGKFGTFFDRAALKKARRLKKYNSAVEVAKRERRRLVREARAQQKLEAARARHEAERAAQAVAELEATKKAKRSSAAKKAAATRAANKAARLAAEAVNEPASI